MPLPTFQDVQRAASVLQSIAHHTPIHTSRQLNGLSQSIVFFKCENFQRVGAFKFRGAYNAVAHLKSEKSEKPVVALSSGNHAQGIALACQLLGKEAHLVMPEPVNPVKRAAVQGYGGLVHTPANSQEPESFFLTPTFIKEKITWIPDKGCRKRRGEPLAGHVQFSFGARDRFWYGLLIEWCRMSVFFLRVAMVISMKKVLWFVLCCFCLPQALLAEDLPPRNPLTFIAKDFSFHVPASIHGGWQTIRLVNQGQDFHQVQFLKLPSGKSAADFRKELKAKKFRQIPPWGYAMRGVNSVSPGREARVILNLVLGEYVLICGIPDIEGRAHVVHSMISSLTVTPSSSTNSPPPVADITIAGGDFSFAVEGLLTPGSRLILFSNDDAQAHEVLLLKL